MRVMRHGVAPLQTSRLHSVSQPHKEQPCQCKVPHLQPQDTLAEIEAKLKRGLPVVGRASLTSLAMPGVKVLQCMAACRGQPCNSKPGRVQVQDTLAEIEERGEAVRELEKSLLDLHQIFLDMAVLVEAQGEMLDNIEAQVRQNDKLRDVSRSWGRQGEWFRCPAVGPGVRVPDSRPTREASIESSRTLPITHLPPL